MAKFCCICGNAFTEWGNNAEPVESEGRCCDVCNFNIVIPARMNARFVAKETISCNRKKATKTKRHYEVSFLWWRSQTDKGGKTLKFETKKEAYHAIAFLKGQAKEDAIIHLEVVTVFNEVLLGTDIEGQVVLITDEVYFDLDPIAQKWTTTEM